ncbi:hypothetical protein [Cryobacterium sp. CG_9.6]|uniref:hypothetical protein n=1 Tax=Cryobacterium sp. CG_9.6 TaxID=2760710 RepID=UPI00247420F7|nr:hypothetical protein [Cryobacterium sp. CG_9.6]MDH6238046.1 hypothetical protein [Cryobacterium sp. CG_9.6]
MTKPLLAPVVWARAARSVHPRLMLAVMGLLLVVVLAAAIVTTITISMLDIIPLSSGVLPHRPIPDGGGPAL